MTGRATRTVLALAGASVMLLFAGVSNAQSVTQLQRQEESAKALLSKDQTTYVQAKSSVSSVMSKLGKLTGQLAQDQSNATVAKSDAAAEKSRLAENKAILNQIALNVTTTSQQLNATQALYAGSVKKMHRTEAALVRERALFGGQLQLVEEHGSVGYLSVIVGAHSFADFISRVSMLGQIAAQAAREVQVIRVQAQAVKQDEQTLAAQKAGLVEAQAALVTRQSTLNQAQILVQQQEEAYNSAATQAVSNVRAVDVTMQQTQEEVQTLKNQEAALATQMASLRGEISQMASQTNALMQAFSSGNLDRQQLYQAMVPVVTPIANQFGLSPALVIAVITEESGGNQSAVSVTGAIGMMQLEPGTAAELGIDPYNTEQNILGGCLYLSQMLKLFNGNLSLALAAYNAGPGAVQQNNDQVPSYTDGYVSNIESLYSLYSSYGS